MLLRPFLLERCRGQIHCRVPGTCGVPRLDFFRGSHFQRVLSHPGVSVAWCAPTAFYLQKANATIVQTRDRLPRTAKTEVRLVATDVGLGAYNVLGAWKDSRDCYYFNDYMEGDNSKRESWIISTANPFKIEMTTRGVLLAGQMADRS